MSESVTDGPHDAEEWLQLGYVPTSATASRQNDPVVGGQQRLKREMAGWWLVVWVCVAVAAAAVVILLIRR